MCVKHGVGFQALPVVECSPLSAVCMCPEDDLDQA
jgi:hypothetical protein